MLNSPSHDVVSSHDAVKSGCKGTFFFRIIKLQPKKYLPN